LRRAGSRQPPAGNSKRIVSGEATMTPGKLSESSESKRATDQNSQRETCIGIDSVDCIDLFNFPDSNADVRL
jgi:hypothetical protein